MRNGSLLFTSESVSEGHPDKIADQISDHILDAFLARDQDARVACEALLADQLVVVAGDFRTRDESIFRDMESAAESIVRQTLADIGYTDSRTGIDPRRCRVQVAFNHQAREIGQGVDRADGELGAGDQGLMFGYACEETPELMPLPISLAHALMRRQATLRRSGDFPRLRPDAKSEVTVRYIDRVPVGVEKVMLSTQHAKDIDTPTLREEVRRHIVEHLLPRTRASFIPAAAGNAPECLPPGCARKVPPHGGGERGETESKSAVRTPCLDHELSHRKKVPFFHAVIKAGHVSGLDPELAAPLIIRMPR